MSGFASKTEVAPEKTRAEIERLVTKYGATKFMSGWEDAGAAILFEMRGRRVRFSLPMPDPKDARFVHTRGHVRRNESERQRAYEQHVRTAWRAMFLVIKAKLEAVEAGIGIFENEFLAHIVIPGSGQTLGEWAIPRIAEAYDSGVGLPPLLPGGRS